MNRYQPLVRSCVLRYKNSTEPQEELMQVGYVGLLKATNNFDVRLGTSLAGYAQPCVSREIKRHFWDKRWQIRVHRSLQELRLEVRSRITFALPKTKGVSSFVTTGVASRANRMYLGPQCCNSK